MGYLPLRPLAPRLPETLTKIQPLLNVTLTLICYLTQSGGKKSPGQNKKILGWVMVATAHQHAQSIGANLAAYCAGADRVLLNLPLTPRLVEDLLRTQRDLKDLTSASADLGPDTKLPTGVTLASDQSPAPRNIPDIRPVTVESGRQA
jgi:hypothetical protein